MTEISIRATASLKLNAGVDVTPDPRIEVSLPCPVCALPDRTVKIGFERPARCRGTDHPVDAGMDDISSQDKAMAVLDAIDNQALEQLSSQRGKMISQIRSEIETIEAMMQDASFYRGSKTQEHL